MATIRLWKTDGTHCDVPEDHECIADFRKAYPLTEPPKAEEPKTAPKAAKKASRNG